MIARFTIIIKIVRPKRTKEEKIKIGDWTKKFILDFKERYGYEPTNDYVEYMVEETFPRNYNLSMDWDFENMSSKDKRKIDAITSVDFEELEKVFVEDIKERLGFLTDLQKKVLWMVKVDGYTQTEVARILNTSIANINKHLKKAEIRVEKYKTENDI